ncbi:ATP-binding cassette domain-containing protein [Afifella sp. YEN Y35]|uniref:ATP-binding cassette domain-containing protein n=1 Tax=Afifella sp. YEN Y35 TaxID=3388337 RepID=UPI0039E061B7
MMRSEKNGKDADLLVEIEGLGVRRGRKWLVRGVDLSIRRGEIVTLIGPNGSGKSTTAKSLLGVIAPDEGEIRRAPKLTVGYVPQQLTIDRTMPLSVSRFMALTARFPADAITAALAETGVAHLAGAALQQLSGGEFQRVLIARALIRKPDLLVFDEPVQGVDFTGEIAIYDLIGQIRDRLDCGILLISHDLHIVMAQTDRVLCLNGHVCCSGPPEQVAASEAYQRLFGPRASETLAIYRHHHAHTHDAAAPLSANSDDVEENTLSRPVRTGTEGGHRHA